MSEQLPAGVDPRLWSRLVGLREVQVTLRNTTNTFARAHPLVVIGGLLMSAAPAPLKPEHKPRRFLFRIVHPVSDRVRKDHDYIFSLLLPDASAEEADAFVAALQRPLTNFALIHLTPARERTVADLLAENPRPPANGEICLEFYRGPIPKHEKRR